MAALYKEQLGEQIKRRRKALGLTQSELADKAHVKESQTVSRWERGERAPNDLENVARALETTAAEMLAELAPVNQSDRKKLQPGGPTQLDRIEAQIGHLADLLNELEIRVASPPKHKRGSGSAKGGAASTG